MERVEKTFSKHCFAYSSPLLSDPYTIPVSYCVKSKLLSLTAKLCHPYTLNDYPILCVEKFSSNFSNWAVRAQIGVLEISLRSGGACVKRNENSRQEFTIKETYVVVQFQR